MSKTTIHTSDAPAAIGTYSQAVQAGDTVYLSGQIPLDPQSMQLVDGTIRDQATQVFENLKAVCQAAGGQLSDIVKINVYLTDLGHFVAINEVMEQYFTEPYPARAAVGVAALPKDAQVEVDGVMVIA